MDKIILATGYEVKVEEGYEKHLPQAILGEFVLNPVAAEIYGWDDGLRLAVGECDRLSRMYPLPYNALLLEFAKIMVLALDEEKKNDVNDLPTPEAMA